MNIKRISKYYYYKIIRLQGNPLSLAGGASIGVLVGLTPTMPFHTLLILLLTFLTRTSAVAGVIMSWLVCNPLTFAPIYFMSVYCGNIVTPYRLSWVKVEFIIDSFLNSSGFFESIQLVLNLGYETMVVLLAGGLVFALPLTILNYIFMFRLFTKLQQKRNTRIINKIYGQNS